MMLLRCAQLVLLAGVAICAAGCFLLAAGGWIKFFSGEYETGDERLILKLSASAFLLLSLTFLMVHWMFEVGS